MISSRRLTEFLAETYRLQVFGGGASTEAVIEKYKKSANDDFLAAARARLAQLDALGRTVDLSRRDFAGHQHQRALRRLLGKDV